jgi:hypothetical protein
MMIKGPIIIIHDEVGTNGDDVSRRSNMRTMRAMEDGKCKCGES